MVEMRANARNIALTKSAARTTARRFSADDARFCPGR
jgi:hypothetical protein